MIILVAMKMTMIILKVMIATRRWWSYSCTSSKSLVATTNYNCPLQKKNIVRQLSYFFFKNIIIIQAHQPRVWLPHPIIIAQCKIPCQATQCQPHPSWWTFFMVFMMFTVVVVMIITLLVEIHLRWKIAVSPSKKVQPHNNRRRGDFTELAMWQPEKCVR